MYRKHTWTFFSEWRRGYAKERFHYLFGLMKPKHSTYTNRKVVKRNRKRAFWEPPRRNDHRDRCTFRYRYLFLQSKLVFQSEQSLLITLHPVPISQLLTSRAYPQDTAPSKQNTMTPSNLTLREAIRKPGPGAWPPVPTRPALSPRASPRFGRSARWPSDRNPIAWDACLFEVVFESKSSQNPSILARFLSGQLLPDRVID